MTINKEAVIHYSGGTDSTCVVCLKANEFDKIHLISYKRFGIFESDNIEVNVKKLQKIFGEDKFVRQIIDINKIYKLVAYDDYLKNLFEFGFFNLAVCGLCKMAMHIRTIAYCLDNNINQVFDGANKYAGNGIATDQIEDFINIIKELYKRFSILYSPVVYEMATPENVTWQSKLGFVNKNKYAKNQNKKQTTGTLLKEFGFFKDDNVKGSKIDKKMQARCFQQFLSNIALNYYYIEKNGVRQYKQKLEKFFNAKSAKMIVYLYEYIKCKKNSKLFKYI